MIHENITEGDPQMICMQHDDATVIYKGPMQHEHRCTPSDATRRRSGPIDDKTMTKALQGVPERPSTL